ncbi:MAG TPA: helicase C-terminal domain-containing protein [Thermomicrobiales bacterium]|nr:helicase C-terminal domain-containing protein [Thermomicrobiales bacterium]
MTTRYVAIDVEATGMNPSRDEILEVAVITFDREGDGETFSTLVRPTRPIPLDIVRLTGIDDTAIASAPDFANVVGKLEELCAGRTIVGHSVQFDVNMLRAAGMALPGSQIDTFQLASVVLPDLPDYSLSTVAAALGVPKPVDHRAHADTLGNIAVFRALLVRLQTYDAVTLQQVAQYAELAGWPTASIFVDAADEARGSATGDAAPRRGPHELAFLTQRERPEPLESREGGRPITGEDIDAAFGPTGYVGQAVDRFEHRPQQEYMALKVAEAFNDNGQLIAEAGTGTGKSMAYLLPAAMHAVERGEPVVVSTNTLALQDQLFRKDIPRLRAAMMDGPGDQEPFRSVTVKGRSNYLCLRRWFAAAQQPVADAAEAGLRAKVTLWLGETQTGDRAELRLSPTEEQRWRQYSADDNGCQPGRCVFQQRNQCFLFRARREAEAAHLVVVNHALLLSDSLSGGSVLPDYRRLIIDEAHHLEDQATVQFGVTVSEREIGVLLDMVIRSDGPIQVGAMYGAAMFLSRPELTGDEKGRIRAGAALERAKQSLEQVTAARTYTRQLFHHAALLFGRDGRGGGDRSLRVTADVREEYAWHDLLDAWAGLEGQLRSIESHLKWADRTLAEHEPPTNADDTTIESFDIASGDVESASRSLSEVIGTLRDIIASPRDEQVYWLEKNAQGDIVSLKSAPLEVGQLLHDRIFSKTDSLILTSATITTDGTFEYAIEHLGLREPREISVPSPFDYRSSTLLYLADDIPEPNHQHYQRHLNETLIDTCAATGGRGLVLFTSYAALQATYNAIKAPLEDAGIVVLAQRIDGSPRQLVDRLKYGDRIVVLGTASFWEGIDIVGDALSLLVIAKLPFSVPSDPVFAARSEAIAEDGGNAFVDYAVPQAVLKFKQGFGRLIRSTHDQGVCVVLDRRVLSKRYGRSFVDSLPECTVEIGSTNDLPSTAAKWMARESRAVSM